MQTTDVTAADFRTIGELVRAGRNALDAYPEKLISAGSGEEVTARRNRAAYSRLALNPRVLRDVTAVDTQASFLGRTLSAPILLAPIGPVAVFNPAGAAAVAKAATDFGTVAFVAASSSPAYVDAVAAAGSAQFLQLTVGGDRGWISELLSRAEAWGALGVCITVDNPVAARRDILVEWAKDWKEDWSGRFPNLVGMARDSSRKVAFTWSDLEWAVGRTGLPIVVKGIMDQHDAVRAAELGARCVYISNHGGRVLDHGQSTIEVLPAVAEAVDGAAAVVVDGGIMHGTDVCKALALGAHAVSIGRLQCWALAAAGVAGLTHALELLRAELANTMALIGCTSIGDLTPACIRPTFAV